MTSEPPSTTRRTRPDAGFRRRALEEPDGEVAAGDDELPARESFSATLARIPDLELDAPARRASPRDPDPDPEVEPEPDPGPVAAPPTGRLGRRRRAPEPATDELWATSAPSGTPAVDDRDDDGDRDGDAAVLADAAAGRAGTRRSRRVTSTPPPAPMWRRVGFAVVLVALVASIPVLGRTGYRLVTESTDGREGNSGAQPGEPGYEELVTSTPTAIVVQTDAEGKLAALTFLALGSEGGGGTVVFLPLETIKRPPGFGIDSLRSAYEVGNRQADDAAAAAATIAGQILNVGIDEVIQLDDRSWAEEVAPVAPLPIDNLDPVDLDGFPLPVGPIELGAEAVGPYLGTLLEGESELGQLARQEQVWRSWLAAVAASPEADAVPGSATSGMGRFARELAAGEVAYETLPAQQVPGLLPGEPDRYDPDPAAVKALVADAVPAPDPSGVGSRKSVRLLNGVAAGPIPLELIRQVTSLEGSVVVIGNGPSFERTKTSLVYNDPAQEAYAKLVAASIGATGSVELDREAPDDIDLTIVYGTDLLDPASMPSSTAATGTPTGDATTTAPTGGP